MWANMKRIMRWTFGWIKEDNAWMLTGVLATLIWFVIDWCMSTTFRAMSNPQLYLVNMTAALLLLAPWMLTRNRIVALLTILIIALVSEANLIYCRTYFSAIPPESYFIAGNMKDFTSSIWPNMRWSDIGFVVIFIVMLLYCLLRKSVTQGRNLGPYAATTGILAVVSYFYILCLGGFYRAYDRLVQEWMTFTSGVPTYTIAGHIVFKLMEEERMQNPSPEEVRAVEEWLAKHKEKYTPNICIPSRKNLVMVICESLESWPIGLKIDGKEITPFLNNLVNDSSSFYAPHVLTQVCSGHSIDGQLIYTSGLLPTSNAVYSMKYSDRVYPSLNKILKNDRNARSILMTTDKPTTWNMLAVERAFGYDSIFTHNDWIKDEMIFRGITDKSFFRQSLTLLKKGELWPENTPTMLTFITFSGHHPFLLKDEWKDPDFNISNLGLPKILENYITITHYVDSQLHAVVDYVNGRNDSEETMIVILGDHEGLAGDRKEILDSSEFARQNVGSGRYTPFIIVNSPVCGRYEGVIGQIDIFPTILDMLGVEENSWRGLGVSVLDSSRYDVAFSAIPPEMVGNDEGCDKAEIEHIKSAQSVSEKIIMHDLYRKYFQEK